MRVKIIGGWSWLILGSLLALAACAPTAAPLAMVTTAPDKPALHFYEFYSPM